jgi:hypothetical protein
MSLTKKLLFLILFSQGLNIFHINAEDIFSVEETIDTGEGEGEGSISEPHDSSKGRNKDELTTPDQDDLKVYNSAKIIAINKITAQSKEIILKSGEPKYFGNIEIKVYKCYKDVNPYNPDSKILLAITEEKVDEEPTILFQGWMMSSNISISTFEHPVYEIFAKDCF